MADTIYTGEDLLTNGRARASATEEAYQLLRRLIVRLELPPGSILNEGFLMEKLHLSRTPMREALQRLEQERLVVILPRRGILVSDISISDLQNIFELRVELEGLCGRLATQRITQEQIAQLEQLFEGVETNGNIDDDVEIDQKFHQLLLEATQNEHLKDVLSRLHCLSLRLLYLTKSRMATVREDYSDYRAVISALKRRDAAAADAALRQHAAAIYHKVRQTFSP